jgi:PAS domain-containing protein
LKSTNFLAGGGEMGALMRDFAWEESPLRSPHTWPQSLRVTIRLMLNTNHPMFIWWGSELIHLAKEALRDSTTRLERLFDQAPSFIAVLRGAGHVFEFANAAYRGLVGNRDVIGKPVQVALPELEEQGFFKLLDDVFRTGKAHVGRRVPVKLHSAGDEEMKELFLDFI